ncbi:MAG: type II secretion system secretin GspD [Thermodesulfobacteriota bacterium]|nr:type II secretion system secretin GspD [Thermodesulfobacteriota bacterium]
MIAILLLFFAGTYCFGEEKALKAKEGTIKVKQGYITMNFKDVDLQVLIKFMSELTGKNFLVDPDVKGKVTIISPEKVTIDEAYKVFLSILDIHGYTALQAGKIIKIIPTIEARAKGVETMLKKRLKLPDDKVITQLVPLKHGDAINFARLLKPLIPKTGLLIPYSETNTLIIIDALSNINRMIHIINELDLPASKEKIRIFCLEYANAEKLASKLLKLFQKRTAKKTVTELIKIISDERTNSLIVLASAQVTADIELIVEQLDQKQVRPRENIHIYSLENAVAEDLAKVLSEIPGKGARGQKGKAPVISKEVQISADKATNTLVIIAEPDEYMILEEIIRKLDMPRTMVYVEALIMEVSTTKALELGVEWRVGNEYNSGYGEGQRGGFWFGGSTGTDAMLNNLGAGRIPDGFAAGVIGRGITLGTVTFPSIGAFVRAVRTDTNFNIISTPQILTLDNEEAVIEVGQNIPFVTSIDQSTTTETERVQTYEYKDVGITLKVTPQINNNRFVRLQIEQSVKTLVESTALGGTVLAPTTTFRTAKTTITVRDGETAVIGGLIEKRMDRGKTQTPCIGSIPGLGWLFKNKSDRDEKTNLLVFLTPQIVENPNEGKELYDKKKELMDREFDIIKDTPQSEDPRMMEFE